MKGCLATIFVTLILALIAGHFARIRHHGLVEEILNRRVSVISDAFPEVDVSYDHFTAKVTGQATKAELEEIRDRIEALREGHGRVHYSVEIIRREPSNFQVTRKNKKITLRGDIDSERTKVDFETTVSLNGLAVDNQLVVSDEVAPFPAFLSAIAAMPLLMRSAVDARLEADPEQVMVSGIVDTDEDKRILSGMFSSEKWSGAKIVDKLKVRPPKPVPPPPPEPPSLSWIQDEKQIILVGSLPNSAVRESLIKAARDIAGKQGVIVEKKLKVGANVQDANWLLKFPQFIAVTKNKIRNLNLRLGPENSAVVATVVGSDAKEEICTAFTAINPPGLVMDLKVLKVQPRPRTKDPVIEITRTDDGIRLNGMVPSKQIHDSIVNAIKGIEDSVAIRDDVKEDRSLALLPNFIAAFHSEKIKNSELSLKDGTLTIRGKVADDIVRKQILAASGPLKGVGIEIDDKMVTEPPPPPLLTKVSEVLQQPEKNVQPEVRLPMPAPIAVTVPDSQETKKGSPVAIPSKIKERYQVFFGTGEYHIRSSQKASVATILQRVKAARGGIVIDGFADERGDPETNKFLSQERANRIRQFLTDNGVDPGRITSVTGRGAQKGMKYPKARKTEVQIME